MEFWATVWLKQNVHGAPFGLSVRDRTVGTPLHIFQAALDSLSMRGGPCRGAWGASGLRMRQTPPREDARDGVLQEYAMSQPEPAREPCHEREEIVHAIKAAMGQILYLHRLEVDAIQNNDTQELGRIESDLAKALALKGSLLDRFNAHLQAHGCK